MSHMSAYRRRARLYYRFVRRCYPPDWDAMCGFGVLMLLVSFFTVVGVHGESAEGREMGFSDLIDIALLALAAICLGLLVAIAVHVIFHVICGLIFMSVAAYTVRARPPSHPTHPCLHLGAPARSRSKASHRRNICSATYGLCALVASSSSSVIGRCKSCSGHQT